MVARQVSRYERGFVQIWLGNGLDCRRTQRIAPHRQVADIVLVELDFQLLFERLRVKTRDLAEDFAYLPGRHTVIDDEIEADLGQRIPQLSGSAVNCAEGAGQIGSEIDDRNDFGVGHPTLLFACRTIEPRRRRGLAQRRCARPPRGPPSLLLALRKFSTDRVPAPARGGARNMPAISTGRPVDLEPDYE
jgi:hypothetical protein